MSDIDLGQLIENRYRLVERLGEGAIAQTFRARDERLDKLVAFLVSATGILSGTVAAATSLFESFR